MRWRVFCWFIKEKIKRNVGLEVDIFVSKKKKTRAFCLQKSIMVRKKEEGLLV